MLAETEVAGLESNTPFGDTEHNCENVSSSSRCLSTEIHRHDEGETGSEALHRDGSAEAERRALRRGRQGLPRAVGGSGTPDDWFPT